MVEVTDAMIQAGLNAPTLGDEHSYVCDYLTAPERTDPDWRAVGGYPTGLHPSHADTDWHWHIVKRIIEAALGATR